MSLNLWIVNGPDIAELKGLVEYAREPSHWHRPFEGPSGVPGDHKPYVRRIRVSEVSQLMRGAVMHVRVVFTFTVAQGGQLCRHASISSPGTDGLPDPILVFTVCKHLGFTGTWDDWLFEPCPGVPQAIAVAQEVPSDSKK